MLAEARRLAKRLPFYGLRVARLRRRATAILGDWRVPLRAEAARWARARAAAIEDPSAPRVLVATTVGGNLATVQFDALVAIALTLRGARVEFLLCDEALPACMMAQHDWYPDLARFAKHGPSRDICRACHPIGEEYLEPLGLPVRRMGTFLDADDRRRAADLSHVLDPGAVRDWRLDGLPVGEHALAGALRFFARGQLPEGAMAETVLRRYVEAGCLCVFAADRLFEDFPCDVVVAHHGIYVPQGVWVAHARRAARRVVTWNPGYRRGCFILSEGDTYHRTMIAEGAGLWADAELSDEEDARLSRYLDSRRVGSQDWISFGSGAAGGFADCLAELGLDPAKPTVAALTSVAWDAQLHYESNAFPDQLAWIDRTIETFRHRPDLNLAIRIHPAEITGNIRSAEPLADHIAARHPSLPPNIAVVGPENPMNTYALAEGCDCALIYSTKTGIELAAGGTPVVVAGEAWIRGKGFSIDVSSPGDYDRVLASLPLRARMDADRTRLARRYARHFFFRRMVELPGFEPRAGWPPYRAMVDSLDRLRPGADAALDGVCDAILRRG